MHSPTVYHVDWAWLVKAAEASSYQWRPIWRQVKDIIEVSESPLGLLDPIKNPHDFYNFSQIGGIVCSSHLNNNQIDLLTEFCAPLMCFDMPDAPSRKELPMDSFEMYAIMAPTTVDEMIAQYSKISFAAIEPLYVNSLDEHRGEWKAYDDVSFSHFHEYAQSWCDALCQASKMGRGVICT